MTSSSPPRAFMILSSRAVQIFFMYDFRLVSRASSRGRYTGTGLKRRFGARKAGGDDGGEGSILGLKQVFGEFWGRADNGEEREGV
jgi:hypothetical protein